LFSKNHGTKKPYNPVIGEVLHTWSQVEGSSPTKYLAEQVSHHPPISAWHVSNEGEGIAATVNASFGVQFGGNSVSVVTQGTGVINLQKLDEKYELIKKTPGVVIKNVVWGTRRMYWEGDILIKCPKTGLTMTLKAQEENYINTIKGEVTRMEGEEEVVVAELSGVCGQKLFCQSDEDGQSELLADFTEVVKPQVHYEKWGDLDPLSSQQVWAKVNEYSVLNDMASADSFKKMVEQDQRERSAVRKEKGEEKLARYFQVDEETGFWSFKQT